jgi:hypothetical protein
MDVHPTKNVSIGIDPYPYLNHGFYVKHLEHSGMSHSDVVPEIPTLHRCSAADA